MPRSKVIHATRTPYRQPSMPLCLPHATPRWHYLVTRRFHRTTCDRCRALLRRAGLLPPTPASPAQVP